MKQHYVNTSNHERFMAGIRAVENRGSTEACILFLNGSPGTGKTTTVDHWGASTFAILIDGVPGMSLAYIRDYLARETNTFARSKFAQYEATVDFFRRSRYPIIFDEAQHGLPNKGECIEYLRRIAERSEVPLVLVCHTSEKHRFSEERMAHIATRVSAVVELLPASLQDCKTYLQELCEVAVDDAVNEQVFTQSGGRFRLMANAAKTLEAIAKKTDKTNLTGTDVKGIRLCEDAMKSLKRGGK